MLDLTVDEEDKCEVPSKFDIVHAPRCCAMRLPFLQTDVCVSGKT